MIASEIRACGSDEELSGLLAKLHSRCYLRQTEAGGSQEWVRELRAMPPGLRALSVSFELETQLTFGPLAVFFANWLDREYCGETLWGLRELEAEEAADIFERAFSLVRPHWERIDELMNAVPMPAFDGWYEGSELQQALAPLDERMNAIRARGNDGLLRYWVPYARKYPERFE